MTAFASFISAGGLPDRVTVLALHEYRLRALACDLPLLVVPLDGRKRLRQGDAWLECGPGQFLMLHQVQQVDVANLPAADGPYRALAIGFPWRLLELTRNLLGQHPPLRGSTTGAVSLGLLAPLEPALLSYLACDPDDAPGMDHAAIGLLLALVRAGHGAFLNARDPSLAARARLMIAAAPARAWKSADLEEAFCVSSATLRRRLQEEGSSFRSLLQEARLHHGLMLLQTGRQPIKAVAAACGYGSLSSFSHAFAARFGLEPSTVANP